MFWVLEISHVGFSLPGPTTKKNSREPTLRKQGCGLVKYHVGFFIMVSVGCETEAEGRNEGARLQGEAPRSRNFFLSFTTISKGGTLSREEGYNFARIEVWFTTRSGILVALTVMEIFTIEIVYRKWRKKSMIFEQILSSNYYTLFGRENKNQTLAVQV